jgi:hypothetical protein
MPCYGRSTVDGSSCLLYAAEATLELGFVSALPFAWVGALFGNFGDLALCHKLGDITTGVLPRCSKQDDRAMSELLVRCWAQFRLPLHCHIDRLLVCYKELSNVGDNMGTSVAVTSFIILNYQAGNMPLGKLLNHIVTICKHLKQSKVGVTLEHQVPVSQLIANLNSEHGKCKDLKELRGDFLTDPKHYESMPSDKLGVFQHYQTQRLTLAVHFQDTKLLKDISNIYWSGKKFNDGTACDAMLRRFLQAFAAYCIAASKKRKRKYYKRGRKMEMELEVFARHGVVYIGHQMLVLKAMRATLAHKVNVMEAKALFDEAIAASLRTGFLPEAALACHRAPIFFSERTHVEDKELASRYLETSLQLYGRWEAWAIVRHLTALNGLDTSSTIKSSRAMSVASRAPRVGSQSRKSDVEEIILSLERSRNLLRL